MSQAADGLPSCQATSGPVDEGRGRAGIGPMAATASRRNAENEVFDVVRSVSKGTQWLNDAVLGNPLLLDKILHHVVLSALPTGRLPCADSRRSGIGSALITCRSWCSRVLSILQLHFSNPDSACVYEELCAEPVQMSERASREPRRMSDRLRQYVPTLESTNEPWYCVRRNVNDVGSVTGLSLRLYRGHDWLHQNGQLATSEGVLREEQRIQQMVGRLQLVTRQLMHVERLSISRRRCRLHESPTALASVFSPLTQLLSLTYCMLSWPWRNIEYEDVGTDTCLAGLVSALQQFHRLRDLSIRCVKWTSSILAALETPARSLASTLRTLDLDWSHVPPGDGALLARALRHLHALEELSLCENNIESPDATIILASLGQLKNLNSLKLDRNSLCLKCDGEAWKGDGSGTWCRELRHLSSLTLLHMNHVGPLGTVEAALLGESLQALNQLKNVELDSNHLGPEGVSMLLHVWQVPGALRVLGLVDNDVSIDDDDKPDAWAQVIIRWDEFAWDGVNLI